MSWGERLRAALWPGLRLLFPSIRVQSLEIVDVGLMRDSMEPVADLFREALCFIEAAGADVNSAFVSNLKRVAIVRPGFDKIAVQERKYGTSLEGHEGENAFLLACRLVWVARYVELAYEDDNPAGERARRDLCFDYVAAFIGRFPEGEQWVEYWERRRLEDWAG